MGFPSVTQVIPSNFTQVRPDVLEAAALRGKLVHNAMRLHALCMYNPTPLPPDAQPYFDSGRRWFDDYVSRVVCVEFEVVHPLYNYVGHIDIVAVLRGNDLPNVSDFKTPLQYMKAAWSAQIVGYTKAYEAQEKTKLGPGMSVRLRADGKKAIVNVVQDPETAFQGFLNALGAFNYFGIAIGGK